MKKFFAVILSLLIVASVMAFPVSVYATTANVETFDPEETDYYSVDYTVGNPYIYTWTPTEAKMLVLSVDDEYDDVFVVVKCVNSKNRQVGGIVYYPAGGQYNSLEPNKIKLTANYTYKIEVHTYSAYVTNDSIDSADGTVAFWARLEEIEASNADNTITGYGTMQQPFKVGKNVTQLPALPAPEELEGEMVYTPVFYLLPADAKYSYSLQVNGAATDEYDLYVKNNDTFVTAEGGAASVADITPNASTNDILIQITNKNEDKGGPYTFTLTKGAEKTLGTENDPDTLVMDELNTANVTHTKYYYKYTAAENGVLSLDMRITQTWVCAVSGGEAEEVKYKADDGVNPIEYPVNAGEEITVCVSLEGNVNGEVYFEPGFRAEGESTTTEATDTTTDTTEESSFVGETITVYFTNSENWSEVNVDYATPTGGSTWPGVAMTYVETTSYGDDVYCAELPAEVTMISFNGGDGQDYTESVTENIADGIGYYPLAEIDDEMWSVDSYIYGEEEDDSTSDTTATEITTAEESSATSTATEITTETTTAEESSATSTATEETTVTEATEETTATDATEETTVTDPSEETTATDATEETTVTDASEETTATDASEGTTATESDTSGTEGSEYEIGDVNGDKVVNVKDATTIQKYVAGLTALSDEALAVADFNGDTSINVKDATQIQKKIAGLI